MRDWIHWLWQQWEWEGDLSPELTREVVRAEEALLGTFTPEQRELYETLEEVRARRDLREQEALFRAGGSGRISFAKIKRHGLEPSGRMKSRHTILKGDSKPCPKRLYS